MTSLFEHRSDRRLIGLCWLFFLLILVRNAWICEDSYITFRVVDNVVHGYGPRWNPLERVQVYTHPLWMLALCAVNFGARDVYTAGISLSIACSAAAVWLLLSRVMKSPAQCLLATIVVTFSKAFMDYSTSGLENPLSHVLLLLFFLEYVKPGAERYSGRMIRWFSLALFNRMDLVWLLLPALAHVTWVDALWRRSRLRVWLNLWPFVGWELFSLLYYGFPFPNPAYAKLGVPISARSFIGQGFYYFANSLAWDPLTLFVLAALTWTGFALWRRNGEREPAMIALGVLLYLAYVVRVGGDYMSGRFLTVPLMASVILLMKVDFATLPELAVAIGVLLAIGVSGPRPPILMRDEYVGLGSAPQWVDDERGFRHMDTSLLRRGRYNDLSSVGGWVGEGIKARNEHQPVKAYPNIGYFGYFAGPEVHVIDAYGIGDPLMARMPFEPGRTWSTGHFWRDIPEGYLDASIDRGTIKKERVETYWRKLELVTRGPIFDSARLAMLVRFNVGLEPPPTL